MQKGTPSHVPQTTAKGPPERSLEEAKVSAGPRGLATRTKSSGAERNLVVRRNSAGRKSLEAVQDPKALRNESGAQTGDRDRRPGRRREEHHCIAHRAQAGLRKHRERRHVSRVGAQGYRE